MFEDRRPADPDHSALQADAAQALPPQTGAARRPPPPRDPIDVHIGARLKLRRRTLGVSQSVLARRLDVTYQQICKYEGGDNRISAAKLFLAAEVLSCPVGFFFEGLSADQPPPRQPASARADRILSHFLSRPEALRLADDFPRIRSPRLRRQVLRLISCLAEEAGDGS